MISDLILFCGGSPVPNQNLPKPLLVMPNSLTVLENQLFQLKDKNIPRITLLVEENYFDLVYALVEKKKESKKNIVILKTVNESTTLDKLSQFLSASIACGSNLLFSYPDIFYFGDWTENFKATSNDERIVISGVPLQSRFPELIYDPYTFEVSSVSLRPTRVPANSSTIYGGHLYAKLGTIRRCLESFYLESSHLLNPILEEDFLKFLSSNNLLDLTILENRWIKADSAKENWEICKLLDDLNLNNFSRSQ